MPELGTKYEQTLINLAELLVTPERYAKDIGQLALVYPFPVENLRFEDPTPA